MQVSDYLVPHGGRIRSRSFVRAYVELAGAELSDETTEKVCNMAWMIEFVSHRFPF